MGVRLLERRERVETLEGGTGMFVTDMTPTSVMATSMTPTDMMATSAMATSMTPTRGVTTFRLAIPPSPVEIMLMGEGSFHMCRDAPCGHPAYAIHPTLSRRKYVRERAPHFTPVHRFEQEGRARRATQASPPHISPTPTIEDDLARRWFALPLDILLPLTNGEGCRLLFAGRPGGPQGPDIRDAVLRFACGGGVEQQGEHTVGDVEFHVRASCHPLFSYMRFPPCLTPGASVLLP